jgi:pyrroloquinoline quinone (PQQ) biosynthesis protein C
MSEFFERLQLATEEEREALRAIPFIQHGVRGELALPSYLAFLEQAYHHVKHTLPLLMACGSRIPQDKEWLREAMAHYISEEVGHQEWILNDIRACGGDAERVRNGEPDLPAELMCAYAYHLIERANPVAFLGMVFVLEGTSIALAGRAAEATWQNLGLPKEAFSYLTSHGALDVSHMQFFAAQVNQLESTEDQEAVIRAARVFFRLYGDVFRGLPLHLNRDGLVA